MNITTKTHNGKPCAIARGEAAEIHTVQDALDLIAAAHYENGCERLALGKELLDEAFFELRSGLAGAMLQKFVQYQMKLAIVGDFSRYDSKALKDFIYESNQGTHVFFAASEEEALARLCAR
jgi:hypothetical protein